MIQADAVNAEGQALCDVPAVVSGLKIQVELIAFADQFAGSAENRSLRIVDVDLQFSAVLLRGGGESAGAQHRENSDQSFPYAACGRNLPVTT